MSWTGSEILSGKERAEEQTDIACRYCGELQVTYAIWDSDCGGYEDIHYRCQACRRGWWVDGPDS